MSSVARVINPWSLSDRRTACPTTGGQHASLRGLIVRATYGNPTQLVTLLSALPISLETMLCATPGRGSLDPMVIVPAQAKVDDVLEKRGIVDAAGFGGFGKILAE